MNSWSVTPPCPLPPNSCRAWLILGKYLPAHFFGHCRKEVFNYEGQEQTLLSWALVHQWRLYHRCRRGRNSPWSENSVALKARLIFLVMITQSHKLLLEGAAIMSHVYLWKVQDICWARKIRSKKFCRSHQVSCMIHTTRCIENTS